MSKENSEFENVQEELEDIIKKTNDKIEELGHNTHNLYSELKEIQELFDKIRNVPSEKRLEYTKLKNIRLGWRQQVNKIEEDYNKAVSKNTKKGVLTVGAGIAVASLGPAVAMGVATTFGVASTGTAISTLSGAAATNAALAWLGGGALATGGGGILAGNALLALAGPIGWTIIGATFLSSGILYWKTNNDQKRLKNIFKLIGLREIKSYKLAVVELDERILRIKDESAKLHEATKRIESFGLDYKQMTEAQHYELGAYVNLMFASTQLLINPILGLQPKYTEEDFEKFVSNTELEIFNKSLTIALANFLYTIQLDKTDKKILCKSIQNNKIFLDSLNISKKEFDCKILNLVTKALEYV